MLLPDSPPGRPQPSIRSSTSCGSSAGTLSSAAWTICAVSSSGRMSLSEPLLARPMGERAVETITASGMDVSPFSWACGHPSPRLWKHAGVTRHLYRCPLRWADMDLLGHVNNVTYVDYLQEARVDMLRVHPPAPGGEELAEGVVVVRHEVQYLAPLVFRLAPVDVEVWVTEVRAATFTLAYEVFDETDGRPPGLPAGPVGAHAVRLRRGAAPPAQPAGA